MINTCEEVKMAPFDHAEIFHRRQSAEFAGRRINPAASALPMSGNGGRPC